MKDNGRFFFGGSREIIRGFALEKESRGRKPVEEVGGWVDGVL